MNTKGQHRKKKKHRKQIQSSEEKVISANKNQTSGQYDDAACVSWSGSNNFLVKTSNEMGRYMVAGKAFRAGEVILSEAPLVVGPCSGCRVQCLACYHPIDEHDQYMKCEACGWPLCSADCKGLWRPYGHTRRECDLLKRCNSRASLDYTDFESLRLHFNCIVPLRCFLLKDADPVSYVTLMSMEHHNVIRRTIPEVWELNQIIVNRMLRDWQLNYSEKDIHSICGILEINAFEIGQQGINIRGLYPSAFLMSHNCIPNTSHCDDEDEYRLTVRASTTIECFQPITLSYAYTLQSTLKRRDHLLENKFFACTCQRCTDKMELGAYSGALRCPKCKDGLVLSDDPLNPSATWSCSNSGRPAARCPGYKIAASAMDLLLNRISSEIDEIDSNDIKSMENILEKYRNVLHPMHYLNLEVKLNLSQLYGKITGFLIHELSDDDLRRKTQICKEILKVFDIIEPGYTRIRGVTLYELHAPVLVLATRQFEKHLLGRHQMRARLREVVRCLEEAYAILANEPVRSSEGIMGIAAADALIRMREWLHRV